MGLVQLAGSYKNPIKRLLWISVGALLIGLVTVTGRQGYFCNDHNAQTWSDA
jgi:quinol-cytochrome oxidoreductase complex cytochrome b subunit